MEPIRFVRSFLHPKCFGGSIEWNIFAGVPVDGHGARATVSHPGNGTWDLSRTP